MVLARVGAQGLPAPVPAIPALPPIPPTVVTAGGQRFLLADQPVVVRYDHGHLTSNRPGWWLINYPITAIQGLEGKSIEQMSQMLFHQPSRNLRNWYLNTPGTPTPEPGQAKGPAPIALTAGPALIVDNRHPRASDNNPATAAQPLRTIGAALRRAGSTIRVQPGIYREALTITKGGTAQQPLRLEGVRGPAGDLPVITGNTPFPAGAWQPVKGLTGVYRAEIFTGQEGAVSAAGETLVERSLPQDLQPGEYTFNRGSREFLNPRFATAKPAPAPGQTWQRRGVDEKGSLKLDGPTGVWWASTYVYVPPAILAEDSEQTLDPGVWHLKVEGDFRARRVPGLALRKEPNAYRVWLNGQLLPAYIYSTAHRFELERPHPERNNWQNFPFQTGWNHLVFQFDTTIRPGPKTFKFSVPRALRQVLTSAQGPMDPKTPAPRHSYLTEYLVAGPFSGAPDRGVYVRLRGDRDPNRAALDLARYNTPLLKVQADFVAIRGFEVRHGAQPLQQGQVQLKGAGLLLEGNLIRDSEMAGVFFFADRDQQSPPITIRNNWIINPGNTGIKGLGRSGRLTSENQDTTAPGRTPVRLEYNTIINSNWAGYDPGWESGGMKLFRLTGSIIRYNTIRGGSGPGIWLDSEHYSNRIEGNQIENSYAYGIGVELSPGPNLLANNLITGLRPGPVWFRTALLAWDTNRTWAVNNTLDGGWNTQRGGQDSGTMGISLSTRPTDRTTRWSTRRPDAAYVNNLVVGSQRTLLTQASDLVAANFTDRGKGAHIPRNHADYRLPAVDRLNTLGTVNRITHFVTHDFYGLLRFCDQGQGVGAFRSPPPPNQTWLEVELQDGTPLRLSPDPLHPSIAGEP